MSSSAKAEAVLALHRFGMGPRPGSIAAIEADPRGALIAELDRPAATEIAASSLLQVPKPSAQSTKPMRSGKPRRLSQRRNRTQKDSRWWTHPR